MVYFIKLYNALSERVTSILEMADLLTCKTNVVFTNVKSDICI